MVVSLTAYGAILRAIHGAEPPSWWLGEGAPFIRCLRDCGGPEGARIHLFASLGTLLLSGLSFSVGIWLAGSMKREPLVAALNAGFVYLFKMMLAFIVVSVLTVPVLAWLSSPADELMWEAMKAVLILVSLWLFCAAAHRLIPSLSDVSPLRTGFLLLLCRCMVIVVLSAGFLVRDVFPWLYPASQPPRNAISPTPALWAFQTIAVHILVPSSPVSNDDLDRMARLSLPSSASWVEMPSFVLFALMSARSDPRFKFDPDGDMGSQAGRVVVFLYDGTNTTRLLVNNGTLMDENGKLFFLDFNLETLLKGGFGCPSAPCAARLP